MYILKNPKENNLFRMNSKEIILVFILLKIYFIIIKIPKKPDVMIIDYLQLF